MISSGIHRKRPRPELPCTPFCFTGRYQGQPMRHCWSWVPWVRPRGWPSGCSADRNWSDGRRERLVVLWSIYPRYRPINYRVSGPGFSSWPAIKRCAINRKIDQMKSTWFKVGISISYRSWHSWEIRVEFGKLDTNFSCANVPKLSYFQNPSFLVCGKTGDLMG